jgi:thioredoxin reductase
MPAESQTTQLPEPKRLSPKSVTVRRSSEVVIIGAGPYALSIAAHLQAKGIEFRIFGSPMHSWRTSMPAGMFLKSEGFASSLYDPGGSFTLKHFCNHNGFVYKDTELPVALETFTAYGLAFQQRFVPGLEEKQVVALDRLPNGEFLVRLENDESLVARRVVVAVGISYFPFVPEGLLKLPPGFLSHSSAHHEFSRFSGQHVTVIGAGASALDVAAALDRAGAEVGIVARRSSLRWTLPAHRPLLKRWYPKCGLGPGLRNRFYERAPMVFRRMAPGKRLGIVRSWLGPSGAWPVKQRIEQLPLLFGINQLSTQVDGSRVHLRTISTGGEERELTTDHIIADTGYRVDIGKLAFLSEGLRTGLDSFDREPVLSSNFESSIPGLYFVGLASALTFGPVMRFAVGARYTARHLSWHLSKASPSL